MKKAPEKRILAYLKRLPQPFRGQSIRNYLLRDRDRTYSGVDSLHEAVDVAFRWGATSQGGDYWGTIYAELENNNDDVSKVNWSSITPFHE